MDDATLEELFASLGPVSIRRMFGGKGIYAEGRIVAVVLRGELLLKTDERTAPRFEAAGAKRWTYAREGKAPVAMPYHALPESAFDDPDEMADWARLATEAAERAAAAGARKTKQARRPSRTAFPKASKVPKT